MLMYYWPVGRTFENIVLSLLSHQTHWLLCILPSKTQFVSFLGVNRSDETWSQVIVVSTSGKTTTKSSLPVKMTQPNQTKLNSRKYLWEDSIYYLPSFSGLIYKRRTYLLCLIYRVWGLEECVLCTFMWFCWLYIRIFKTLITAKRIPAAVLDKQAHWVFFFHC